MYLLFILCIQCLSCSDWHIMQWINEQVVKVLSVSRAYAKNLFLHCNCTTWFKLRSVTISSLLQGKKNVWIFNAPKAFRLKVNKNTFKITLLLLLCVYKGAHCISVFWRFTLKIQNRNIFGFGCTAGAHAERYVEKKYTKNEVIFL